MSSRSPAGRAVVLLLVAAAATACVAGPATARAPPYPVCGPCSGDTLADAADDRGVALGTGRSTLDVRVFANATTRWTVRLDLTDGADAMRNDTLRRAVVGAAVPDSYAGVSSRVDGGTLVVTYRRPDAAERELGAVLFTPFHASGAPPLATGGEGTAYPGADALTVHAPEGYVLAGGAGDGNVSGTAARWAGPEGGDDGIDRDAVPTFVPDDALLPGVRGGLARLLAGY